MQCKILLFQGLGANLFFEDDLCQFDNEEIDLSKDVCVCFVLPGTFVFLLRRRNHDVNLNQNGVELKNYTVIFSIFLLNICFIYEEI